MSAIQRERFWAKVDQSGDCWLWTGAMSYGYGHFVVDRVVRQAHRVSYEWFVGAIPAGRKVGHTCDNLACVRPDHLELRAELMDRLFAKVDASGDCWEWTAFRTDDGYGRFQLANRANRPAHRVVYELLVGPIPAGLQLDHLCRNRGCVKPDHLEPVTKLVNGRRGFGPTARHGRSTTCPRGHLYDALRKNGRGTIARRCTQCDAERDRQRSPARRAA